jgi:hypothetical protein
VKNIRRFDMRKPSSDNNGSGPSHAPRLQPQPRADRAVARGKRTRGGVSPDDRLQISARISASKAFSPPSDVALANRTALERGNMARGDVVDVHQIESRVDECRHAAGAQPRRSFVPLASAGCRADRWVPTD